MILMLTQKWVVLKSTDVRITIGVFRPFLIFTELEGLGAKSPI